jgi:hypothetical protein
MSRAEKVTKATNLANASRCERRAARRHQGLQPMSTHSCLIDKWSIQLVSGKLATVRGLAAAFRLTP